MISIFLLISIAGLLLQTNNHMLTFSLNLIHLSIFCIAFGPALISIPFSKERKAKVILQSMYNSYKRIPLFIIWCITASMTSFTMFFILNLSQDQLTGLYFLFSLIGSNLCLGVVYLTIKNKKMLVNMLMIYFSAFVVISSIVFGVLAQITKPKTIILNIFWSFSIYSFKKYMQRDIPFFLTKFLFLVLLISGSFTLVLTQKISLNTILYYIYYLGMISIQMYQIYTLYNKVLNGQSIAKQGSLIIMECKIKNSLEKIVRLSEQPINCAICFQQYQSKIEIAQLPCKHEFHKNCLQDWLRMKQNCPICREKIAIQTIEIDL